MPALKTFVNSVVRAHWKKNPTVWQRTYSKFKTFNKLSFWRCFFVYWALLFNANRLTSTIAHELRQSTSIRFAAIMSTPCGFSSPIVLVLFHTARQYPLGKTDRENCQPLDWKKTQNATTVGNSGIPSAIWNAGSTHSFPTLGWSNFRACIFFFPAKYSLTALFTAANAARLSKEFWKRRGVIYHTNMGYAHVFIEQRRSYRENI